MARCSAPNTSGTDCSEGGGPAPPSCAAVYRTSPGAGDVSRSVTAVTASGGRDVRSERGAAAAA
jgi:hypothetical protein